MSIAPTLPNPFTGHVAIDTWKVPPWHLPELHRNVLNRCRGLLESVRAAGMPTGLLVRGETGCGKTQLIAQFRAETASVRDVIVIHIPMQTFAGGMWRHVRGKLVHDLLTEIPGRMSGLMRMLDNRFAVVPKSTGGGWSIADILTGGSATPSIAEMLDRSVGDELPYGLQVALPKLYDKKTAQLARFWLRGQPLADADYKALGLPNPPATDVQQENEAREIVLALLRLAGDQTLLAICLDEVEGMKEGCVDTIGLKALATLATQLVSELGPRLVVTFIRPETLLLLQQSVEVSNLNKMAQHEADIPPVEEWTQVEKLYATRLAASPAIKAVTAGTPKFWPLGEPFLRKLMAENTAMLTPRLITRACAAEFQRIQYGKPPVVPNADDMATKLRHLWDRRRGHHLDKPAAIVVDKLFAIGLPWLRETAKLPFTRVAQVPDALPDINLVFRPDASGLPIGVSFCNQNSRTIWPRLNRLMLQWNAAKKGKLLGRLILIRAELEPRTKATNGRFDELRAAGATPLLVPNEQLAELAAFEELFSKSKSGAMTDFGKPLAVADYCDWAARNLSDSVKELADSVFGEVGSLPKPAKKAAATA